MALSLDTTSKITEIIKSLLPKVVKKVDKLSLKIIMEQKNPLVREIFSDNPQEFISFFVMQTAERSFVTLMGQMIENIVEILVEGQGGKIIGVKKDWKPYDIKFTLNDGKEYWLEIKSILNQNKSSWDNIKEHREKALKDGKEFRLCVCYHTNLNKKEDYILVGKDFWRFIGGHSDTESLVFQLIKETKNEFSFIDLVEERTNVIWQDYINKYNK
ncbi:hypothetical protein H6G64_31310 [Calothrix sp. FACHB-156]|nr:hypothetical protein [Calothrix sp. FACHB-156]